MEEPTDVNIQGINMLTIEVKTTHMTTIRQLFKRRDGGTEIIRKATITVSDRKLLDCKFSVVDNPYNLDDWAFIKKVSEYIENIDDRKEEDKDDLTFDCSSCNETELCGGYCRRILCREIPIRRHIDRQEHVHKCGDGIHSTLLGWYKKNVRLDRSKQGRQQNVCRR